MQQIFYVVIDSQIVDEPKVVDIPDGWRIIDDTCQVVTALSEGEVYRAIFTCVIEDTGSSYKSY